MLWGLKPVEQKTAYGLAIERLKQPIRLGLMLPGERLPSERRLSEQIGISRVTLREALSVLETQGYITIRRGATGGAFVAEEGDLRQMAINHISADPALCMRVFEFREMAEPLAAGLSAVRRTPADLKRMEGAIAALEAAETSGDIKRAEATFQLSVAQGSGNQFLMASLEEALAALFLPLPSGDAAAIRASSLDARRPLALAIAYRDEAGARLGIASCLKLDRARLPARQIA